MSKGIDVLSVLYDHISEYSSRQEDARNEGNDHYADQLDDDGGTLSDLRKAHAAIVELIFASEQMRIDMNITRSNVMAEISKGRDRWDGVPEILEYRISKFDAALSRVRGGE